MKRNLFETILGAVVLCGAIAFLIFSYNVADLSAGNGYTIHADFAGIGGLGQGDSVQVSGVKVGVVSDVELQTDSYLARVYMDINESVFIPEDTAALISSESLLGGRFLLLEPGASDVALKEGDRIQYTQAPQNLEQLLGQFIFSLQDADKASE